MNQINLIVKRVSTIDRGRIALQVEPPNDMDLQYIYRAALSIFWDSSTHCLEDRYIQETSVVASFERIVRALQGEYGLELQPSANIDWDGVNPEDRKAIEQAWI